jgi:hypothetical protein
VGGGFYSGPSDRDDTDASGPRFSAAPTALLSSSGLIPSPCPDFLWNLVALANFMRLSLLKGARAASSSGAWQEIRVPGWADVLATGPPGSHPWRFLQCRFFLNVQQASQLLGMTKKRVECCGIPLKPKNGLTPISCNAVLERSACAPFIKERGWRCVLFWFSRRE